MALYPDLLSFEPLGALLPSGASLRDYEESHLIFRNTTTGTLPSAPSPCYAFRMPFLEEQFGEWKPVSRTAGIIWLCVYGLFLLYAAFDRSGFLFPDYANLIIHEGGHFFFSWFGRTIMILGGTLGELLVPLLCAAYFFAQRDVFGVAFSGFWFLENFPYIGAYMADARAGALPLVGGGEHDWEILLGQWGLLMKDQAIGGTMRAIGWIGMLATVAWLAFRVFSQDRSASN